MITRRAVVWGLLAACAAGIGWQAIAARAAGTCTVRGLVVTPEGLPVADVTLSFSNGLPPQVTGRLGVYAAAVPADGESCTITPSRPGYRFEPAARTVWLSGDAAEAGFQAIREDPKEARRRQDTPFPAPLGAVDIAVFAINGGELYATSRNVTLDNVCFGSPTHYMASELPSFTGATWQPYSTAPLFTLSPGNDPKTVYFKVTDGVGVSVVAFDSILLHQAELVELTVDGPVKTGYAWPSGYESWFFFTAAAADTYSIETWPGSLTDTYLELYAADQTTLLASDDASGENDCAKIDRALAPGIYFVKVRAGGVADTGTFRVGVSTGDTKVTILSPHGDPTATTQLEVGNSEVVFTATSPGVLEVVCRFTVAPGTVAGVADKVRACIEPVGPLPLAWQTLDGAPSGWVGSVAGKPPTAHSTMGKARYNPATSRYEVKAVFAGLPASNAAFGPKKLWAQVVDGATVVAQAEQPLEVFFPRTAANNAGAGVNAGPNWFYFWKTGNVCGMTTGWEYENVANNYGFYVPGQNHVNLCDLGATWNSGPEHYQNDVGTWIEVAGQGIGPHCAAEVLAHEGLHKWIFENWAFQIAAAEANGETNGDAYDDPDDDGIPNLFESSYLGIATDPNDPDTWNMGGPYATYGDQEIRCRQIELNPGLTVTDAADWAHPGTNSYPRYPRELAAPIDDQDQLRADGTGGDTGGDEGGGDTGQDDDGNPGNDRIRQYGDRFDNAQTAHGGGGDDRIVQHGRRGADTQTANAGTGNDEVRQRGGRGADTQTANAGDGDDRILQRGKRGNDELTADGGEGDDNLKQKGGNGADIQAATGGPGNDDIRQRGGDNDDTLSAAGGEGNDFIWQKGGSGNDTLLADGGEGNDIVWMVGGDRDDMLTYQVSPGADQVRIRGGGGNDTATIHANSQSFRLLDRDDQVLYQQGSGGSVIHAYDIESLTVIGNDGVTEVYTGSAP